VKKDAGGLPVAGAFWRRTLSALVLLPLVLGAVWFGRPWLTIAVLIAGSAMAWEWGRLCGRQTSDSREFPLIVIMLAAIGLAASGYFVAAVVVAVVGAVAGGLLRPTEPLWAGMGMLWIAGGLIAFLWLATPPQGGRETLLWLLGVVWATDILAYAAGKTIGGPKLAPGLSPNKTWAGFAGGILGAMAMGGTFATLTPASSAFLIVASLGLSVVAQAGDLAESQAKRHFGVKDSSGLIPGHGGFLDRLDGLIAASIASAMLALALGASPLEIR